MKKIELIVILTTGLSIALKSFQLPFGGELLTIGLSSLAVYYTLLYGYESNELFSKLIGKVIKDESQNIFETKIAGFTLPLLLIAILYKLQHYPYADTLFSIGLTACSILLLIVGVNYFRTKNDYLYSLFKRLVVIGGIGLVLFLVLNDPPSNINIENKSTNMEISITE